MSKQTQIPPVPITAFSSITACGLGNKALYHALRDNLSGLGKLQLFEIGFDTPVGEVKNALPEINSPLEIYNSRNARMALAALDYLPDGLRASIETACQHYGRERVGVVIGTSTSGLYESEHAYQVLVAEGHMPDDFEFLTRHAYQATARFLQRVLNLKGPCYAISTACSSGVKSIAAGQRLIANDVCDAVLVGGVDTLCRLTLRGFHSLGLISEQPCQPMDQNRRGINIGEGAGLLLLEKPGAAHKHRPHVLAIGESSDAHHMSTPHPEGKGAVLAMNTALQLAGLSTGEIDYINLHATATPINDQIEAIAIQTLFNDTVPCSGSKGITGHTLGAAGAIETIISLLALEHRFIPGTCGLQAVDKSCDCRVIRNPQANQNLHRVMSNSFGFGGNNASIILAHNHE